MDSLTQTLSLSSIGHFVLCLMIIEILFRTFIGVTDSGNPSPIIRLKDNMQNIPNGWLPIAESREVKTNQIKSVVFAGQQLIVVRVSSGNIYVFDAFCPHSGANIAFGGQVVCDLILCPFNRRLIDSDGEIRLKDSDVSKAKVWDSCEINGFVFVWHHIERRKPEWRLNRIEDITESDLRLGAKLHFDIKCHIQDIAENSADSVHFNSIHSDFELFGVERKPYTSMMSKVIRSHQTSVDWQHYIAPNHHHANSTSTIEFKLFNYTVHKINVRTVEFGLAHGFTRLTGKTMLGAVNATLVEGVIPLDWMRNKLVMHIYSDLRWPCIFALKHFISVQVGRDMLIWNHKKYLSKPYISRNEKNLRKFRNWTKFFYSDAIQ